YLVTGAFGGLGRRVSEYLAEEYGADLVLVGRSPSGAADRAWVEALRAHGGRVESWTLDVTDERALAER
ncbi:SDR family NAD(P)-dependent oxidoreductase, partial [Nocardiopsis halotolerans]|uniref:SDR family NAD(P)-dependent oxidoreductase n=1 Tax=Nocardiopsis halotolerans TaxID=124252 RepID=UPI000594A358